MSKVWLHSVNKVSEQWVSLHGWMGFRETLPCARFAAECSVGISVNSLNTMNTLSCSNVCHIARNQESKHCMRFWNINAWWWTESKPTNEMYKAIWGIKMSVHGRRPLCLWHSIIQHVNMLTIIQHLQFIRIKIFLFKGADHCTAVCAILLSAASPLMPVNLM